MGPHRPTESEIGRPADLYRDRCGAPVPISLMRPTRDKDQVLRCAAKFLKSNHCNIRGAIFS
jgi:hypothetical protein